MKSKEGRMSDYTRLNKGFVNWQGQRVFVPWFGAPRIAPSVGEELGLLKARYRAHIWMAVAFVPSIVVGVWFGDVDGFTGVTVGVSVVFGIYWAFERRRIRTWPIFDRSRFAGVRFMLFHLRTRPMVERLNALTWSGLGLLLCAPILANWILVAAADGDVWFPLRLAFVVLGPGLLTLLTARHTAIALLSLIPVSRKRLAQGMSHGA
jgi:hypothetical protein